MSSIGGGGDIFWNSPIQQYFKVDSLNSEQLKTVQGSVNELYIKAETSNRWKTVQRSLTVNEPRQSGKTQHHLTFEDKDILGVRKLF